MRGVVLLLAAGEGTRLGADGPKAFCELGGMSLLQRAAIAATDAELVDSIVVAAPIGHAERVREELTLLDTVLVVDGGATRQASAASALSAAPDAGAYLVHDAARALAPSSLFDACLRELDECEAACPGLPIKDTIKQVEGDHIVRTLDRSELVAVQTPQGFRADVYRRAHAAADRDGFCGTDDCSLVERLDVRVRIIPGDDRNMKITTTHDIFVAEALLGAER